MFNASAPSLGTSASVKKHDRDENEGIYVDWTRKIIDDQVQCYQWQNSLTSRIADQILGQVVKNFVRTSEFFLLFWWSPRIFFRFRSKFFKKIEMSKSKIFSSSIKNLTLRSKMSNFMKFHNIFVTSASIISIDPIKKYFWNQHEIALNSIIIITTSANPNTTQSNNLINYPIDSNCLSWLLAWAHDVFVFFSIICKRVKSNYSNLFQSSIIVNYVYHFDEGWLAGVLFLES